MKILFAVPRFPYPPIQGDRVRSYHFLRLLKQKHAITLVTPLPEICSGEMSALVAKRWRV